MPRAARYSNIKLVITEEDYATAIRSASGGCLIADAIKKQHPHFTNVRVDMATIRFSDRKAGKRYIYLTPPEGQHALLSFDQGWPNPVEEVLLKRPVQILPITGESRNLTEERRRERIVELEAKADEGTITQQEKGALTQLRKREANPPKPRPASRGRARVSNKKWGTIEGGRPLPQGPAHPNLLRSLNRHFGAKLADPGLAFQEAVEAAVADRLANGADNSVS